METLKTRRSLPNSSDAKIVWNWLLWFILSGVLSAENIDILPANEGFFHLLKGKAFYYSTKPEQPCPELHPILESTPPALSPLFCAFWPGSFPVWVHLKTTLVILSLDILVTWLIKPSQPVIRDFGMSCLESKMLPLWTPCHYSHWGCFVPRKNPSLHFL